MIRQIKTTIPKLHPALAILWRATGERRKPELGEKYLAFDISEENYKNGLTEKIICILTRKENMCDEWMGRWIVVPNDTPT